MVHGTGENKGREPPTTRAKKNWWIIFEPDFK